MLKVNLTTKDIIREIIPSFLTGLRQESLNDLGWTDPALNVQSYGWWKEIDVSLVPDKYTETYDTTEQYVLDEPSFIVEVSKDIRLFTQQELDENLTVAKNEKMVELHIDVENNSRPTVAVPLEDTSTIYINGSREDQFDIGDRYNLMQENSIPSIYLKDANDNILFLGHLDIKRCYKAITIHRNNAIEYQWFKEIEISDCTTIAELELVTWDFSSI